MQKGRSASDLSTDLLREVRLKGGTALISISWDETAEVELVLPTWDLC